ncbi:ionotropic receptor 85a [Cochliomyia hominivorax]
MWRQFYLVTLIICSDISWSVAANKDNISSHMLPSHFPFKLKLLNYTSRIFCNSQVKVVNVYFENETSLSYPGKILKVLNDCGVSHISFRNKFRTTPPEILKDDGIEMYLIMVLRNISQSLKLNMLRRRSASKYLTFIILMIENPTSVTKDWLYSTFEVFWNMWILNVAVIYYDKGLLHINRYDPFQHKLFPETAIVGKHNLTIRHIFPRTILNMRRKPLRMCMYHDGIRSIYSYSDKLMGSDGLMSSYLAERLNATRIVDWVKPYGNTSISSDMCFKEIVDGSDDVALNIRFLSLETFYKRVEPTIVHSRDDLCVIVPKAKIASSFWNLFRSFNMGVWFSIVSTLILACGFCLINYRKICQNSKFILQLYACIISMPFLKLHKPTSLGIFLYVWMVYGMLISVAFKANLTGNLVDRQYLPDINTIQDLAESPYMLATLPRHLKHLHRYIDPRNKYGAMLKEKVVEIPDLQFKYLIDKNNLSYGYLQKYHVSIFRVNSRMHSQRGRPLFHVMNQCIVPFHAVYIVPYGSPYLGFINTLLRNAQEFGFINYWDRLMNAAFRSSRRSINRNRRNEDDEPVVLKLSHYEAVFCFWYIGLALSSICFIIELLSTRNLRQKFDRFIAFITFEV